MYRMHKIQFRFVSLIASGQITQNVYLPLQFAAGISIQQRKTRRDISRQQVKRKSTDDGHGTE